MKIEIEMDGGSPADLPDGYMRVGPIRQLSRILREAATDPERFLSRMGVAPEVFGHPNQIIPVPDAGRLLHQGVLDTGCTWFGLRVGREASLDSLRKVSALVAQAETLGEALRGLVQNLHLQNRGAAAMLFEANDLVTLGYTVYAPGMPVVNQYEECAIAIALNILRTFCGPNWRPAKATFARRKPEDERPYREFFRCKLLFDAELTAIHFPRHLLDLRINPAPRRAAPSVPPHPASGRSLPLAEQIRRMLPGLLAERQCSQEVAARRLGMHRRTLIRHLEQEGTGFRTLADEARFVRAQQLIINTDLALEEIAACLDYSEASAFSRAFSRWAGESPMRWRG